MDHAGMSQDSKDLKWYRENSTIHPPKQKEWAGKVMTRKYTVKQTARILDKVFSKYKC